MVFDGSSRPVALNDLRSFKLIFLEILLFLRIFWVNAFLTRKKTLLRNFRLLVGCKSDVKLKVYLSLPFWLYVGPSDSGNIIPAWIVRLICLLFAESSNATIFKELDQQVVGSEQSSRIFQLELNSGSFGTRQHMPSLFALRPLLRQIKIDD